MFLSRRTILSTLSLSACVWLAGCASPAPKGGTAAPGTAPAPAAAGTEDPAVLMVALLPDQDAGKIMKDNEGLQKYLAEKTGKKVELVVTSNYAAMIEAVRQKHVHLAFFGPASYVQAKDSGCDIEPFAALMLKGKPTYYSVLITRNDAGINDVKDAKGKKVALGDKLSTSSSNAPRAMLYAAGLVEGVDYEAIYTGKHDSAALACQMGNADLAGLGKEYFEQMVADKKIDGSKLKVVKVSEELVEYPWALQNSLVPALKEKIKNAFWDLKDPAILAPLKKAEGFAKVDDASYNGVRGVVAKVKEMEGKAKAAGK